MLVSECDLQQSSVCKECDLRLMAAGNASNQNFITALAVFAACLQMCDLHLMPGFLGVMPAPALDITP